MTEPTKQEIDLMRQAQIMAGFFPQYYLSKYKDVAKDEYYGASEQRAYEHYTNHGIKEGRSPNPFFEPKYYQSIHKDLADHNYTQLREHWIRHGIKEGRRGSQSFDLKWYVSSHSDLDKTYGNNYAAGFRHWINHGNSERRMTAPDNIQRLFVYSKPSENYLVAVNASKDEPLFKDISESDDPDILKPGNTTGGKLGFAVGTLIGIWWGPLAAAAGAALGSIVGHSLDRICTYVANDITGPMWHDLEQGVIGRELGNLDESIKKIFGF